MSRRTLLYVSVRAFANAIAIMLVVWLLPGFQVTSDRFFIYLLMGVVFGLINATIRPATLILTGKLVILTMGIFTLVINALMLWLLDVLFPSLTIAGIVPLVIGTILMGIFSTVLEILLGLTRPIDINPLEDEKAWRGLEYLSTGRRSSIIENMRMQQVYQTLWRYGLDMTFDRTFLRGFRRSMQLRMFGLSDESGQELSTPAKVRMMLQELGPTYVKIGQMVSSRSDILPVVWREELSRLQSNVPPFSYTKAREIICHELGAPPEELFASFDTTPLAAASTAQIHRATLHDGCQVVVKVQRPDILVKVKSDLGIMRDIARSIERRAAWARNYNLTGIVNEFADNVIAELDYRNEAYNLRRMASVLEPFPDVRVPQVYGDLSTSRVLTMEFVRGVKITDVAHLEDTGVDRRVLAQNFVRAMVKQLLIDGFFHGDPHPGNILVDPQCGTIIFLDCGMVGDLRVEQRLQLVDLIFSLIQQDGADLAKVFLALSQRFKKVDEARFRYDLDRLLDRYLRFTDGSPNLSAVVSATLGLMYQHGLRLDNALTLALKTLIQAEEATTTLDPTVFLVEEAYADVQELMMDQLTVDNVTNTLKREAIRSVKEVVRRIPSLSEATVSWLEQYQSGRLTMHLDVGDLSAQLHYFSLSVKRLTVGLILMGMLIGSAIAVQMPISERYPFLPLVTIALLIFTMLISGVLALRMIGDVWRRD